MTSQATLEPPPASTPADQPGPRRPAGTTVGRGPRVHRGWLVMVVAGLLAAVGNYMLLTGSAPGVQVAVVAADTPAGTPLPEVAIRYATIDVDDELAEPLVTAAELDAAGESMTRVRLPEGALLRHTDMGAPDTSGGAMSLPIDASRAVGGDLVPGDTVDVLADLDGQVQVVVAAVEVLAVTRSGGGLSGVGSAFAVTLAVESDDALVLATALREAEVDLVRVGRD